jgi:hypothetical protein
MQHDNTTVNLMASPTRTPSSLGPKDPDEPLLCDDPVSNGTTERACSVVFPGRTRKVNLSLTSSCTADTPYSSS